MSREIIYDKLFIKVANKIIPMILSGSNNCYELSNAGRERRERSWFAMSLNQKQILTGKELIESAQKINDSLAHEDYTEESFLSHCAWEIGRLNSFKQFNSWLNTGIKKAITVEQLKELGHNLTLVVKESYSSEDELRIIATDTNKFIDQVEDYENSKKYIRFTFNYCDEKLGTKARKKFFPRVKKNQDKELRVLDKYFTIKVKGTIHGEIYLRKHTSRKTVFSYTPYKVYAERKKAERLIKQYNKRYHNRTYFVEEVNEPIKMFV